MGSLMVDVPSHVNANISGTLPRVRRVLSKI